MRIEAKSCDNLPLDRLLSDENGDEIRTLTAHVEQCVACQARLAALAADEPLWREASESLSDRPEFDWAPDDTNTQRFTAVSRNGDRSLESTLRSYLSPPSHPELLGRLGRYDIERVIGSGGMGIVLKAHDGELNRPVAIKVLASHLAHVGAARERFAREGRAAAAVVHEHVVAIHNVETNGTIPFLVMQYVAGESLQGRVDAAGPLAVEQILRIGIQAASGLAAAHAQGLVHRDVKPSNILLEESVDRAVLTDFGLARAIDDASLTYTGVLAGTPHYMSPEQATGGAIDSRSDLFSLGAVLYFMATGHPPFRAEGALGVLHRICNDRHRPAWQTNTEIPDELSDLIDELLEKKPARRPASAAQVSERLSKQLSTGQRIGFRRRKRGGWRSWRRHPLAVAAASILAAGIIGWSALALFNESPEVPSANVATQAEVVPTEQAENSNVQTNANANVNANTNANVNADVILDSDQWYSELGELHQRLSELEHEQGLNP